MQKENMPTEGQNSTKLETESALRGAACSPSFVVVRNTDDFHKVRQWCIDNMKGDPMIRVPHKFPIGISALDERAGWTDHMDRAAKYIEVRDFLLHNDKDLARRALESE